MEQHPIPRNISSFQFHLIGDMTLRQFVYLAIGAFGAYFIYRTSPLPSIITLTISAVIGFIGIAFAFLPVSERPLDRWLAAFIKSILSPTQYTWKKHGTLPDFFTRPVVATTKKRPNKHIAAHKDAKDKLKKYLASQPTQPHETLNIRERKYINQTLSLFTTTSQSFIAPAPRITNLSSTVKSSKPKAPMLSVKTPTIKTSIDTRSSANTTQPLAQKPAIDKQIENNLKKSVKQEEIQSESKSYKKIASIAKIPVATQEIKKEPSLTQDHVQQKLDKLSEEKKRLLEEINRLKQNLKEVKKPKIVKPTLEKEEKTEPTIKTITPKVAVEKAGILNFLQTANIVTGIIKDPSRKILPNIIVTIKDKNGLPQRALKTNKLGQFVTATPLPNGTYYLEIEDPLKRYIFDIAEINLTGKTFPTIEMIARGEKEIIREKLEKAIFGSAAAASV